MGTKFENSLQGIDLGSRDLTEPGVDGESAVIGVYDALLMPLDQEEPIREIASSDCEDDFPRAVVISDTETLPSRTRAGDGHDGRDGTVDSSSPDGLDNSQDSDDGYGNAITTISAKGREGRQQQAAGAPESDAYRELGERWGFEFFLTQDNDTMVRLPGPGRRRVLEIKSSEFRWEIDRRFRAEDLDLKTSELKEYQNKFESLAAERTCAVDVRSRWAGDDLWLDLCDDAGRALLLRGAPADFAWSVVADPPCVFRQNPRQRPLPVPDFGGDPEEVLDFFPGLPAAEDRLALLGWLAGAYLNHPKPILTLLGAPGCGKSSGAKVVKRLLDPADVELLGDNKRGDWEVTFYNHALVTLDNLNRLVDSQNGFLCKATTGGGVSRRKLFADRKEVTWQFMRPVVLTAVELPTGASDLIDRLYILPLTPLTDERRHTEAALDRAYFAARPRLLGAVLGLLRDALNFLPTVPATNLGRLADWHRFLRAVAKALGREPVEADKAYRKLEQRQKLASLHNPLVLALYALASRRGSWEGTPSELLKALEATAHSEKIRTTRTTWPVSPVALGQDLNRYAAVIAGLGVTVETRRTAKRRMTYLTYSAARDGSAEHD